MAAQRLRSTRRDVRLTAATNSLRPMNAMPAARSPQSETIRNHAAFIWSVADLLRGDYKQSEYGKVILPLTVLRRLDCVLEPTKQAVLDKHKQLAGKIENVEPVLQAVAGRAVLQHVAARPSRSSSTTPTRSPTTCAPTSAASPRRAKDVIEKFDFDIQIDAARPGQPALPGRRASSPTSTCTPTPSRTSRWATSSRS